MPDEIKNNAEAPRGTLPSPSTGEAQETASPSQQHSLSGEGRAVDLGRSLNHDCEVLLYCYCEA